MTRRPKDEISITSNQTYMLKMSPVRKAPQMPASIAWVSGWWPWCSSSAVTSAMPKTRTATATRPTRTTMIADSQSATIVMP